MVFGVRRGSAAFGIEKDGGGEVAKNFPSDNDKKMGYSGADVARFLGINTSAVNRLAVSDGLPDVEKYVQIVLELASFFGARDIINLS